MQNFPTGVKPLVVDGKERKRKPNVLINLKTIHPQTEYISYYSWESNLIFDVSFNIFLLKKQSKSSRN